MATGTIFDSPWFALERPAFERIAAWSNTTLSLMLIVAALVLIFLAMNPRTPTLLKAVAIGWIVLP